MTSRSRILAVRCRHCGVGAGVACHSVGDKPIADPHMKRLEDADAIHDAAERELYARNVVELTIGECTDVALARAKKERAIDVDKPFWRKLREAHAASEPFTGALL